MILEDMAQYIPRGMSGLCLAGPGLPNVTGIWFCSSATLFPALFSIPALLSLGSHRGTLRCLSPSMNMHLERGQGLTPGSVLTVGFRHPAAKFTQLKQAPAVPARH